MNEEEKIDKKNDDNFLPKITTFIKKYPTPVAILVGFSIYSFAQYKIEDIKIKSQEKIEFTSKIEDQLVRNNCKTEAEIKAMTSQKLRCKDLRNNEYSDFYLDNCDELSTYKIDDYESNFSQCLKENGM